MVFNGGHVHESESGRFCHWEMQFPAGFGSTLALQENIPFQPQIDSIDPGNPGSPRLP